MSKLPNRDMPRRSPTASGPFAAKLLIWTMLELNETAASMAPLMHRRQAPAGKLGVGRRFVPADSGDRQIFRTLRKRAELPGCWSGPARQVAKMRKRFIPGQRAAVFDDRLLPILRLLVPSGVYELHELSVGHFVLVHPEARQRERGGRDR